MRTCLVVDDSRVIRKVARRIIEDMGFEVFEACDGLEALAWCRAAMPDAILLDWNMPALNGIDFLRQLRQEPGGEAPRVVFCTVENSADHIRDALDAGAAEYIMKPFDSEIVQAKFAEAGLKMKPDELDYVAELARVRAGLKVDRERLYVVESRLGPVARREGFGSIREMLLACRQRKDERLIWTVIESLAAGETFFFRDKQAFARLGEEILPELMRHRGDAPIRVWSACCSTGQEPYSLALQVEEAREQLPPGKIDILGTDLSERSLHKAQEGLYNQFEIQRGLPIRLLLRHFERHDEMWRVSPRIRAMARWRRVNLNADFRALGRFDVIFCRNVLEGMEPTAATRTFEQLSLALEPGGYLVLSGEEDAPVAVPDLQPAGHGIYRADPHRVAA